MSESYIHVGLLAKISSKDKPEDYYEDIQDDMLYLNYEQTLAVMLVENVPSYEFSLAVIDNKKIEKLKQEMIDKFKKLDVYLSFNNDEPKFFVCDWYNGSDNPIKEITLGDFSRL